MVATHSKPPIRKPKPMPRSFSRVLGKLLAMPFEEGVDVSKTVWKDAQSDDQKFMAMRLRLRVLHNAYEHINAHSTAPKPEPEAEPEVIEEPVTVEVIEEPEPVIMPEAEPEIEFEQEIDVEPEEEPESPPTPAPKGPTMMKMDLEGDALSSMFAMMGADDDDE